MPQGSAAHEYDPNGNLTSDMNKSIFKIEYNFLNLPVQIFFNNGAKIKILYDAAGTKLRKTYTDQNNNVTTQDYDGGIEYYNEVLNMIPHPEGRVAVIKKDDRLTYRYEYVITDHLGNARVTFADVNGDQVIGIEDIIQENHYYPFGLDMQGAWTPPAGEWNRHKYNGKDWNKEEALNWYDYGARWYDPAVGRWWSVDPLAEVSRRWSLYAYCYDNPMRFVDPDGMLIGDFLDQKGNKIGTDGIPDKEIYVITDKIEVDLIKKNNKSGGVTSLESLKSSVKLPSEYVRCEMNNAVQRAGDPSNHEEGGFFGTAKNGNDLVVHAKPGLVGDPSLDPNVSINPFLAQNPNDLDQVASIEGTFHTHPNEVILSGEINPNVIGGKTKTSYWENTPSGPDIENAKTNRMNITGNSYVLAQGNKTVYIYNGNGVVAILPFKAFFPSFP